MHIPLSLKRLAVSFVVATSGLFVGHALSFSYIAFQGGKDSGLLPFLWTAAKTYTVVHRYYAVPVSSEEFSRKFIEGIVTQLDPHSAYIPPEKEGAFASEMEGKYGGVGIMTDLVDGKIVVVDIHPNGPAAASKVALGDVLVSVDAVDSPKNISYSEMGKILDMVRGVPGEKVRLGFERSSSSPVPSRFEVDLVRRRIDVGSAFALAIPSDKGTVAYIQLRQFVERSTTELHDALNSLKERPAAVVLDLRDNPGGLLRESISVAGLFLPPETLVVSVDERRERRELRTPSDTIRLGDEYDSIASVAPISKAVVQSARKKMPWLVDVPMAVIIDGGSASASEIVAAALKEHRRAVIVGQRSYGKGSVQSVIPLGEDGQLKLTTSLYLSPSGKTIQARGVEPDVPVELPSRFREENIDKHLSAEKKIENAVPFDKKDDAKTSRRRAGFTIDAKKIRSDPVVSKAIEAVFDAKRSF